MLRSTLSSRYLGRGLMGTLVVEQTPSSNLLLELRIERVRFTYIRLPDVTCVTSNFTFNHWR